MRTTPNPPHHTPQGAPFPPVLRKKREEEKREKKLIDGGRRGRLERKGGAVHSPSPQKRLGEVLKRGARKQERVSGAGTPRAR